MLGGMGWHGEVNINNASPAAREWHAGVYHAAVGGGLAQHKVA